MTRQEEFVPLISSILTVFMEYSESNIELFGFGSFPGAVDHARRTAFGFCKGAGKSGDLAFRDEAEAEAIFLVTELILTKLDEVKAEFPDENARLTFYRMRVGYGLRSYFAHRAKQTISDWKKKGKEQKREELKEDNVMDYDTPWLEMSEEVLDTPYLQEVIALKIQGMKIDEIAKETKTSRSKVKKAIRLVKRRIQRPSKVDRHANIPSIR